MDVGEICTQTVYSRLITASSVRLRPLHVRLTLSPCPCSMIYHHPQTLVLNLQGLDCTCLNKLHVVTCLVWLMDACTVCACHAPYHLFEISLNLPPSSVILSSFTVIPALYLSGLSRLQLQLIIVLVLVALTCKIPVFIPASCLNNFPGALLASAFPSLFFFLNLRQRLYTRLLILQIQP